MRPPLPFGPLPPIDPEVLFWVGLIGGIAGALGTMATYMGVQFAEARGKQDNVLANWGPFQQEDELNGSV